MTSDYILQAYNRARLDDRSVNELLGLAHGIVADGVVNRSEAEYLLKWLAAHAEVANNPVVAILMRRVREMLVDGVFDQDEQAELHDTLQRFAGGNFEVGELHKGTSLPLDRPAPRIEFPRRAFCFTGSFAFGSRRDCETAVALRGGSAGSLRKDTDYLVIGIYATSSWMHSSFGLKIKNAVDYRARGFPIRIVSEEHWAAALR